jgi:hypothetical protein
MRVTDEHLMLVTNRVVLRVSIDAHYQSRISIIEVIVASSLYRLTVAAGGRPPCRRRIRGGATARHVLLLLSCRCRQRCQR